MSAGGRISTITGAATECRGAGINHANAAAKCRRSSGAQRREGDVSKPDDGGPVYPHLHASCQRVNETEMYGGISLRDYFAAKALQGFLANGSQRLIAHEIENSPEGKQIADTEALRAIVNNQLALGCYRLADAMLAERTRPAPGDGERGT